MVNSWVEEFAEFIAKESYNLVTTCGKKQAEDVSLLLSTKFIQYYTEIIVLKSLSVTDGKELSSKQNYTITKDSFMRLKTELQTELAKGFENAFRKYAGKNVEYYCQINPVPEPISKLAN